MVGAPHTMELVYKLVPLDMDGWTQPIAYSLELREKGRGLVSVEK